MTLLPECIYYTRDQELVRRIEVVTGGHVKIGRAADFHLLEMLARQCDPCILLLDLREKGWREVLERIRRDLPDTLVIALGVPRSEPVLEVAVFHPYAVEDVAADSARLRSLVLCAKEHIRLVKENRILKEARSTSTGVELSREQSRRSEPLSTTVQHLSRLFRFFTDVNAMLDSVVDTVASCTRIPRVGLFAILRDAPIYKLRAHRHCLETTLELEVPESSDFVAWLRTNAHLVSRRLLPDLAKPSERVLLESALNAMGAEVIIPLHGRTRLMGWLFLGRRATGAGFDEPDLEELATLGESISFTVESALLHEQIAVQKALSYTLLDSVPVGIVAIGEDNQIRWFNRAAEFLLSASAAEMLNQPVSRLTSRLQDVLLRTVSGEEVRDPVEWTNPVTGRVVSIATRRLMSSDKNLGGVAILYDLTRERQMREKQARAESAAFWTELAAALAHVVRNPLVTISTFAQLLPERYQDEAFRTEFAKLALDEIQRLNSLIDELQAFANPPPLRVEPVDIIGTLKEAQQLAVSRVPANGVKIELHADPALPTIHGDKKLLVEGFAHVMVNALEAFSRKGDPLPSEERVIQVSVRRQPAQDGAAEGIILTVRDNAGGILESVRDKVLSPFGTTKARGVGLGLPTLRRIVADHNGFMNIEPVAGGTCVSVMLPAAPPCSR
ncbi:MAG: ATP-binding protein [Kiritimatiellae bacterium]|nr:ATP-binding protein [Kiritimatiellia bacterium]